MMGLARTRLHTLQALQGRLALLAVGSCLWVACASAVAKPSCDSPDNVSLVTGAKECLVIRTFGSTRELSHPVLVAVLHGDVSSGGPANYHFGFAQERAQMIDDHFRSVGGELAVDEEAEIFFGGAGHQNTSCGSNVRSLRSP